MAVNKRGRDDSDLPADPGDERIAALYREAAREEPPARIDRAIADAARGRGAAPAREAPWWLPWRMPFAVAALAVVSVSLVTLMVEEDPDRAIALQEPSPPAAGARDASAPTAALRDAPADMTPPTKTESADAEKPRRNLDARRSDAPSPSPSPAPPPTPETSARRAPAPEAARPTPATAPRQSAVPEARERPQSVAPELAVQARGPAAAPPPVPAPQAAREPQPFPAAPPAAAPTSPSRGLASDSASGPGAPLARLESQAALEERKARQSAEMQRKAGEPAAKAAPPPGRAASAPARDQVSGFGARRADIQRHVADLEHEPPAAWIERVLALRKQGRAGEADALLAELRKRHPDLVLPPELR